MDYAATITALSYIETVTHETTTPLGTTSTTAPVDVLVARFAVAGVVDAHDAVFLPDAVGNRMAALDLTEPTDGVEAIVAETVTSWATPDATVTVDWTDDAWADAVALSAALAERVEAARARFAARGRLPETPSE